MKISKAGLDLIKKFEGLRLIAYKAVSTEKYYTIGYGHYGADVVKGMVITEEEASRFLEQDVEKSETAVNDLLKYYDFNQNQFDALVSFTFNCGKANLTQLTKKHTREISEISEKILEYNKASGVTLAGLVRRRREEKELFDTPYNDLCYPKYVGTSKLIDVVFKAIGVHDSLTGNYINRRPLAELNGIKYYKGSSAQNLLLIQKAKEGSLLILEVEEPEPEPEEVVESTPDEFFNFEGIIEDTAETFEGV